MRRLSEMRVADKYNETCPCCGEQRLMWKLDHADGEVKLFEPFRFHVCQGNPPIQQFNAGVCAVNPLSMTEFAQREGGRYFPTDYGDIPIHYRFANLKFTKSGWFDKRRGEAYYKEFTDWLEEEKKSLIEFRTKQNKHIAGTPCG